jgi:hypothetical protein
MLMRSEPPSKAQNYREEARRIRLVAARSTNDNTRQQFLNVADQYDALAASLEREPRS